MISAIARKFLALWCALGFHKWQAVNDLDIPYASEDGVDPDRITDVHCARCAAVHPVRWFLLQSDGPGAFKFPQAVTEKQALQYLSRHFKNSSVDYIDREWHCIYYRVPRKVS